MSRQPLGALLAAAMLAHASILSDGPSTYDTRDEDERDEAARRRRSAAGVPEHQQRDAQISAQFRAERLAKKRALAEKIAARQRTP